MLDETLVRSQREAGGAPGPSHDSALAELTHRVSLLEQQLQRYAPIEPLYSLPQACVLLPCSERKLARLLHQHRLTLDQPMYRHGPRHRRFRMLSHQDLLALRAYLVKPARKSRRTVMHEMAA